MVESAPKRDLSTSSLVDMDEKRQKLNDDEAPAWAKRLFSEVFSTLEHTKNNTNKIVNTVQEVKVDVAKIKDDVENFKYRMNEIEDKQLELEEVNGALNDKVEKLELQCAETIDRSMRASLTVHHIPKNAKETWDDTANILAKFLAENSTVPEAEWKGRIERAHRGKTTVIHIAFESWKHAEMVRLLFRDKQGKIGDVFCLDKYSPHTQDRRTKAYQFRKDYRERNHGAKLFLRYPAIVMCKKVGDVTYNEVVRY